MPDWIWGIVVAAGVPALMMVWNLLASRESTVIWGWSFGNLFGGFMKQKLGIKSGKVVSDRIGTTLDDFSFGVRLYLQGKPKPTKQDLKDRATKQNNGK